MRNKIIILCLFISNLNYVLYNSVGIDDALKNGIRIIIIGLLLGSIVFNKKTLSIGKIDLTWIFLLFLSLFSFNINYNILNFFYIILVLIASQDTGKDKLLKYNYYNMIASVIFVVVLLNSGIINNVIYTIGTRKRYTFGFLNVNSFSSFMYSAFIMYFMYKDRLSVFSTIVMTVLMFLTYRYTDSRTSMIALLIYVVVYIILKKIFYYKKLVVNKKIIKVLILVIAFAPIIFSFMSPVLLKNYPELDELTSNRLSIFTNYINNNQLINYFFGGTKLQDVDNGYLTTFFSTGILFTIFLLFIIVKSINYFVEIKNYKNLALIISFMYFNAFESLILRPELTITIYFWLIVYNSARHRINYSHKRQYALKYNIR